MSSRFEAGLGSLSDVLLDDWLTPESAAGGEIVGRSIGPYQLISRLGTGGMGCVYLAPQEYPVRRLVALKLSRPALTGSDPKRMRARFDLERQALADLDHPHIAELLDAGDCDAADFGAEGWPYFVLEFVNGTDIVSFCDEHELGITDRVRLMAKVCRALQHAHFVGLLHRDLKPSNIMIVVDPVDGPTPKLIDFGLAAELYPAAAPDARLTLPETPMGTPIYADVRRGRPTPSPCS